MSRVDSQSVPQETFLLMSTNLLHRAFVEASRNDARRLFRALSQGEVVPLASVTMEDNTTARFSLALEHSEFRGKMNFRSFRASLENLIRNIARALQSSSELKVFNAQNESSAMIFGITAVTVEDEVANVMVLAAQPAQSDKVTKLQLMYLDPDQFSRPTAAPEGS